MQSKAFKLLNEKSFQGLYDLSVGKVYSNKIEMMEYVGEAMSFDTGLKTCTLKLGEKGFEVDYIGTHSLEDNMWFTAELESQIPDAGVKEIITVRKLFSQIGLGEFYAEKLEVNENVTPEMLATIYTAFMPEQQVYYVGKSGSVSLFMRVKGLPSEVFAKISPVKFVPRVMEIISNCNVKNHKLMVESFLLNNGCVVKVKGNTVVGVFNETEITFVFDDQNRLVKTEGVLNDEGKKHEAVEEVPTVEEEKVEETAPVVLPEVEDVEEPETAEEETPAEDEEVVAPVVLPEVEDVEAPVVLPPVEESNEETEETEESIIPTVLPPVEEVESTEETEEAEEAETEEEAPVVLPPVEDTEMPTIEEEPVVEAPVVEDTERPVVLPEIEDVSMPQPAVEEYEEEAVEEPIIPVVLPAVEDTTYPNEVEDTEYEEAEETPETITADEDDDDDNDEEYQRIMDLAEAMLNCSEQVGLFEELGVEDQETINKICTATGIRILNNGDSFETVRDSLIAACERNHVTISEKTATQFASCYIDCYHGEE